MKDILTIIFRLTLSCILAATVMGTTFVLTNKAKKHNEHVKEERVAFSLLGFEGEAPESVAMNTVYRYVVSRAGEQFIGYLMPGENDGYVFLQLDLDGNLVTSDEVNLTDEKVRQQADREGGIMNAIGPGNAIRFAEQFQVISNSDERAAYLITGKFPGYKTNIAVMMALNTDFSIIGFEVLEHEEDPGLGGEIEKPYFKNQFKDKPFEVMRDIDVIKEPIPNEYLEALERDLPPEQIEEIMEKYRGNDIYALTGATISAVAVADGLKGMIKKFAYRVSLLDSVTEKNESVSVIF
ncbi:MAG: FMN-binding protein [Desulfocapsaceae bacterium]|nr:FMN-binding protein [Desulfocapsaceae bacterium]